MSEEMLLGFLIGMSAIALIQTGRAWYYKNLWQEVVRRWNRDQGRLKELRERRERNEMLIEENEALYYERRNEWPDELV